jgi:hypothetical protein
LSLFKIDLDSRMNIHGFIFKLKYSITATLPSSIRIH